VKLGETAAFCLRCISSSATGAVAGVEAGGENMKNGNRRGQDLSNCPRLWRRSAKCERKDEMPMVSDRRLV